MTSQEMERERAILEYVNKHVRLEGNILMQPVLGRVTDHIAVSPFAAEGSRNEFLEEEKRRIRLNLRAILQEICPIQTSTFTAPVQEPLGPSPSSPAGIAAGILGELGEEFWAFVRRSNDTGGSWSITSTRADFKDFLRELHEPTRDLPKVEKMLAQLVMKLVVLYSTRHNLPILKKTAATKEEAWRVLDGAVEALNQALNSEHAKEVEHRKALEAQLVELHKQEAAAAARAVASQENMQSLSAIRQNLAKSFGERNTR